MKKIGTILIVLLVLFSCSGGDKSAEETKVEKVVPVKVLKVSASSFVEYGEYYGEVSGIEEAHLISFTGGKVESINVKEGDFVKKGTSLGSVNGQQGRTMYDIALLNEKIAYDNYLRQEKFLKTGNASQLIVDQSKLGWLNSKNQTLDAERAMNGALCITPIDGTVVARYIDVHQEIGPGMPTFSVSNMDKLKVSFGVPEKDVAGIDIGNEALIYFDIFPNKTWEGKLVRLDKKASPKTLTFQAEVEIDNPEGLLISGITAKVELKRQNLKEQIVVPSVTILNQGMEKYVMVAEGKIAKKYEVEVGSSNKNQTIVLNGLSNGAMLITEGNHIVVDGSSIKVLE